MQGTVGKVLSQYGTTMVLQGGGAEHTVRAMLQPTFSKSMQNMEKAVSPLGISSKSQYVYTGPAEPVPEEGWQIRLGGRCYRMRKVEPVYWGDSPAFCWGLCTEVEADA